jgi:hypothetical protein
MADAPRFSVMRRRLVWAGAVLLVVVTVAGAAPQRASAARSVFACFSLRTQTQTIYISQLATRAQFWTGRRWRDLEQVGSTSPLGCVKYNLHRWVRYRYVRVWAGSIMPQWKGLVYATSSWVKPGRRAPMFANGDLTFLSLANQPAPTQDTTGGWQAGSWVDSITGGGNCPGYADSALLVACYMDRHRLTGNTVVLDFDMDGRLEPDDKDDWDPTV